MKLHDQTEFGTNVHNVNRIVRRKSEAKNSLKLFQTTSRIDDTIGEVDDYLKNPEIDRCQFDFLDSDGNEGRRDELNDSIRDAQGTVRFRAERPIARPTGLVPPPVAPMLDRGVNLAEAATVYLRSQAGGNPPTRCFESNADKSQSDLDVFAKLHEAAPQLATSLARGLTSLPNPGETFLGFQIVEELGRGAFGRVFLAKQGELAGRLVALKVTAELPEESQTLAQLQHTNIVPIFSTHQAPPLYAVCMPYFGRTTLADLLDDVSKSASLPESGKALVKTVESRRSDGASSLPRFNQSSDSGSAIADRKGPISSSSEIDQRSVAPELNVPPLVASETLHRFDGLSYVDTILWMLSRIADGLAHAHDRGILHRDLKPANVLMTDDGQPMILDFNLSEDLKNEAGASTASAGGTLRYMSPEHIERFVGQNVVVDARSDLYALGVIFYELVTGESPFVTFPTCSIAVLHKMIQERRQGLRSSRKLNPAISPAVDSMIRHCLEADPARRYQSAAELHEDLERHLAHLPLKHATDPSIPERVQKWCKRHPRLGSTTTMVVLAIVCVLGLASTLWVNHRQLLHFEAAQKSARFHDDASSIRFLLNHWTQDRSRREEGKILAQKTLAQYAVLEDSHWDQRPLVNSLTPEAATQLHFDAAEILLMLTQAIIVEAVERDNPQEKQQLAQSAQRFNAVALANLPTGQEPQAFRIQQADLVRLLGQDEQAVHLQKEAEKIPLKTARDHYLAAARLSGRGAFREALPLAEEAVRLDPQHFWAYFVLGVAHDHLEHHAEAMACFTICTALRPDFAETWLYRGLAYMKRNDPERARLDFDRAQHLRPDWYEPLLNRGLAQSKLGDHVKAENDLTRALDLGAPKSRIFFLRAAERQASGDRRGSELDLAEGLKREPTDARSWVSRGMARMATNPEAALADFQEALKLEPNLHEAMQFCAYLLSNTPGRDEATIQMMDRMIGDYPNLASTWSSRGVQFAILGKRDEALRDAQEAVWRDTSPAVLYQVAGIYATTSKTHAEDKINAYRYLASALRAGYGFELLDSDLELDAIRNEPEFRALVDSARLQAKERLRRPIGR